MGEETTQATARVYSQRLGALTPRQLQRPARAGFAQRYALFMLRDRLIIWEYGTRPGNNWFPPNQSFRDYAEPFTLSWRLVAPAAAT